MAIVVDNRFADFHHMHYHEYRPELAPTEELKNDWIAKRITWAQYKDGYYSSNNNHHRVKGYDELIAKRPKAQQLLTKWKREYANSPTKHLTLLCYCLDKNVCHRSLVKEKILEAAD